MLHYQRHLPAPALRHLIHGYWLIQAGSEPTTLDLVSDGHPELMFLDKKGFTFQVSGEQPQDVPLAGLIGQFSKRSFFHVKAYERIIYVKLYPWTPYLLFHTPCDYLKDSITDISALPNAKAYASLSNQLQSAENLSEIAKTLDDFFLKKIADVQCEVPFIPFAVQQIFKSNGTLNLCALTDNIQVSRRYVEKVFKQHIGLSPKQYVRLIRVKKASLLLLKPQFSGNIGYVAAKLQYFDSSHFYKDFKVVAGRSPSAFLKEKGNLPLDKVEEYLQQWDYS